MLHSNFLVFSFPSIHHTCSALLSDSPLSFLGPISFSFECNGGMRAGAPSAGGCEPAHQAQAAAKSYPTSEVRGSSLECQAATAHERSRGATLCLRSVAAGRRHTTSEARDGSWEEPPTPAAGRSSSRSGGSAGTGGPRGAISC